MPRPTSSDYMCCPRVVMACHARRFRPCVMSKGGDDRPRPTLADRLCRRKAMIELPTSSFRVCCPKALMACHAIHRSTAFPVQGR